MKKKKLEIDLPLGIKSFVAELIQRAKRYGCAKYARFNDVELVAHPNSTCDEIIRFYYKTATMQEERILQERTKLVEHFDAMYAEIRALLVDRCS